MTTELEKETAMDLIRYKLRDIQNMIEDILNRWNEVSNEQFLENARNGHHINAENDAIDLRQLIVEEETLNQLLGSI